MQEAKFKIKNGIPENHEIFHYKNNKVYLEVVANGKLAKFNFESNGENITDSITFYIGVLTGWMITDDINKNYCEVTVNIQDIS